MTDQNVQPAEQADHFAQIAAELRKVADDVEALAGSGLPKPRQFQLNIQPGGRGDGDLTARAVDAMAQALLGISGTVNEMGSGNYHYGTDHLTRGPLQIVVYQGVPTEWALANDLNAVDEAVAAREAELELLRAKAAELRASRKPTDD